MLQAARMKQFIKNCYIFMDTRSCNHHHYHHHPWKPRACCYRIENPWECILLKLVREVFIDLAASPLQWKILDVHWSTSAGQPISKALNLKIRNKLQETTFRGVFFSVARNEKNTPGFLRIYTKYIIT